MDPIPVFADKVTHVTIPVSDQDASLNWYQRVLGAQVVVDQTVDNGGSPHRILTVRLPEDNLQIALAQAEEGRAQPGEAPVMVLDVKHCERFIAHAREQGADATDAEKHAWGTSAFVQDPDGNAFNVIQPPTVVELV